MSALSETPLVEKLRTEFQDEDYRYAYDEEFSNARMATQIKVIREQRKLKQVELAELAEMKQSRISELENVNYNSWSISTLRRLARALGVRLSFKFESWGELLPEIEGFGREPLKRPEFKDDSDFKEESKPIDALTHADAELRNILEKMQSKKVETPRAADVALLAEYRGKRTRTEAHETVLTQEQDPLAKAASGRRS